MGNRKASGFSLLDNHYYQMAQIDLSSYQQEFWDVHETISELAYLTHSYFRYYGKFPSKIGKLILEDLDRCGAIARDTDFVFDNYAGSGTTLVEAKLKGYDSYGVDINPFAVLACRVKTRNYSVQKLNSYWQGLSSEILACRQTWASEAEPQLAFFEQRQDHNEDIRKEIARFRAENKDAAKWFSEEAITCLSVIKALLLSRPYDIYREFFELAFFAIIRRVSVAYDGEVRPHVNKKKRKRDVIDAYSKKVTEMIALMQEWNACTKNTVRSDACLCNNASSEEISSYIGDLKTMLGKELGAVISHPPYLNCFDYIPVFKLGFMWASGFDDIYQGYDYQQIRQMELRSYPASTPENIEKYFKHNEQVYRNVFANLRHGGSCCIVIGDCTIQNHLFEVHKAFITMMEGIGFATKKIAYRSTAYGTGQYAYKFRADYSEDVNRKKDGVLFFRKP